MVTVDVVVFESWEFGGRSGSVDMRYTNDLSGGTGTAVVMRHEL